MVPEQSDSHDLKGVTRNPNTSLFVQRNTRSRLETARPMSYNNPDFREIGKQSVEGYFETRLVLCYDMTTLCLTGWKPEGEEES